MESITESMLCEQESTVTRPASANGRIPLGILGAFLFAILGGVVYFGVYQLGYIAGICGFIMFALAGVGYNLFAKPATKHSLVGLIVSLVMMLIITLAAEYMSLTFVLYQQLKELSGETIHFLAMIPLTFTALMDEQIRVAFIWDLLFAYLFGILASVPGIVTHIKGRRACKKEEPVGTDDQPIPFTE